MSRFYIYDSYTDSFSNFNAATAAAQALPGGWLGAPGRYMSRRLKSASKGMAGIDAGLTNAYGGQYLGQRPFQMLGEGIDTLGELAEKYPRRATAVMATPLIGGGAMYYNNRNKKKGILGRFR